ncbi:MAG: hypothetical protein IKC48_00370 [Clostridia bacterium]|nr:hypothetical protein [Clostridia bacterium]
MKNKKLNNLVETVVPILSAVGLLIYGLITKNQKVLIILLFFSFLFGAALLISYFITLKNKIFEKKIKDHYDILKQKDYKNIFENFFILTYQNKCEKLIKQSLQNNKIKDVCSLNIRIANTNQILMDFIYKEFKTVFIFTQDTILHYIDSPSKYYEVTANKKLEEVIDEKNAYSKFSNLDQFADYIARLINNLTLKIDAFSESNIVDPIFNGSLLDKFSNYLSFLKKAGLICVISTPFLGALAAYGSVACFADVNFKIENPFGFYTAIICCPAFFIFCFAAFIYGIKALIELSNFKKDYKQKNLSVIFDSPYKVKILKEKLGKYSSSLYLKAVILYYENIKLSIPFPAPIIYRKENIKKCCTKCTKVKAELKYLTKSKIVVAGDGSYYNIIKKLLL